MKIARELYRNQLNQLLRQTDRAYWDLAFAREDVEIRRRSRDRALLSSRRHGRTSAAACWRRARSTWSRENVVNFDDSLIRAEETLALAESALRRLLNLPPTTTLIASSSADTSLIAGAPEAESLGVAAAKNPAVVAAKLAADRADVTIGADVRRALPQLDVFGSFRVASSTTDDQLQAVPGERQIRGGLRLSCPSTGAPTPPACGARGPSSNNAAATSATPRTPRPPPCTTRPRGSGPGSSGSS